MQYDVNLQKNAAFPENFRRTEEQDSEHGSYVGRTKEEIYVNFLLSTSSDEHIK